MYRNILLIFIALAISIVIGCASTMKEVNKGANEVGKAGGTVLQVPHSVSEGAAEGIAGESDKNPYER